MQSNFKGCNRIRYQLFTARHGLRKCSTAVLPASARCLAIACAIWAGAPAGAIQLPASFGNDGSSSVAIGLTGNIFADGSGSVVNTKGKLETFQFKAPLNHSLSLFEEVPPVTTYPVADYDNTSITLPNFRHLSDIQNLKLDFFNDYLNGQSIDFALDTILVTTNSTFSLMKNLPIDVSGTLSGLRFEQSGPASVLGGDLQGTFSLPGNFIAGLDNLLGVVLGLFEVPADSQGVSIPGSLTGTWSISTPFFLKVSLDGSVNLDIPLSLVTNLTTGVTDALSLTISSTLDLLASLNVTLDYHVATYYYPEPGSIVLLGIGLAAVVGVAMHRRRR